MVIGFVGLGNVGMNHHVKRISIADTNGNLDINGNVNINLSVKAYGVLSDVESKSVNVNSNMIGNVNIYYQMKVSGNVRMKFVDVNRNTMRNVNIVG